MQPPTRGRPTQPGRGRAPARWTGIEIALIMLSVVMIAYPLLAGGARLIAPPAVPAQESTVDPALPPTETPDPVFVPPPSETPAPPPSETLAPPTNTPAPGGEQVGGTATARPPTATATQGTSPPTATSTTDPSVPATATSTTNPNPPTATLTQAPVSGVRLFKVASVSEAVAGQNFSYSVSVITDSPTDQTVQMSDSVSGNLEVLSASSSSGSCTTGQTVTCGLTIRADNPASVTIQVRVRAGVAAGTNIPNSATAGGATSATVNVRVGTGSVSPPTVTPTGPTLTPSPSPTGPTLTPSPSPTGPTATPITPIPTTATPVVAPPTATLVRPPTSQPQPPTERPREDPPREERPPATEVPPAPPAPPTPIPAVPTEPPTPQPVVANPSQPQVRPTAAVRPTRVTLGATRTPAPLVPITDASPQPTGGTATTASPVPGQGGAGGPTDIFFRLASDWGSAYPGQQVNFTIALRNTRASAAGGANDLRNVSVRSSLPGNLQVLGARADRGSDPAVSGNDVSYTVAQLQPGEGVEITVETRIRPDVTIGTLLVGQAQLTYEGLSQTAFSNIVSVQVVGNAQPPTAAAIGGGAAQQATATTGAYPPPATGTAATAGTAAPTATLARTAGAGSPTAVAQRPTVVPTVAAPRPQPAPLPQTSAGVPLLGIALLGSTLLTRTWRLHRAKSRL